MAGLWDKLNELKNEHGDLSKYVSRMENVFSTSNEEGESTSENQDPTSSTSLEPPQIRVTEPGTGEHERRPSMASVVSSIMSLGAADKPEGETGQPNQAQVSVVPNGDAVVGTTQPSQLDPASTDISKPPEVQTIQPTYVIQATNGAIPNGHHAAAAHKSPVGKGGAKGALIFSVCTLILCPVSFLCTIPSCICAFKALKNTTEPTPKLTTSSFLVTASFYVISAIVASFALGAVIFGGVSILEDLIAIFTQLTDLLDDIPDDEFMTTIMVLETESTPKPTVAAG